MPIRKEAAETDLSLVGGPEESWSRPEAPPRAKPDRRSLYEREQARAAAAEARVQELLNDIRRLRTAETRSPRCAPSPDEWMPEAEWNPAAMLLAMRILLLLFWFGLVNC